MNTDERRIRLTETDSMEGGVRCPACGAYTSFGDIIVTGECGAEAAVCAVSLALELVVEH